MFFRYVAKSEEDWQNPGMENNVTGILTESVEKQGLALTDPIHLAMERFFDRLARAPRSTERAYRGEVRRLLVWMAHQGYAPGALASLATPDIERYFDALRSANPIQDASGTLVKHAGPLADASLGQAKARLSAFFGSLMEERLPSGEPLCPVNPVARLSRITTARRQARQPGERISVAGETHRERCLSGDDVRMIRYSIEAMPETTGRERQHKIRCRWLFELAILSWLRISEIARLQMGDFEYREERWQIYLWPSKHATRGMYIDAGDRLMEALTTYRRALGKPAYPFGRESGPAVLAVTDRQTQLPGERIALVDRHGRPTGAWREEPGRVVVAPLGERALFAILKQVFHDAADRSTTPDQVARLRHASPHWLRHTWITMALNAGIPVRYVAGRARHRQLLTTLGTYDQGVPEAVIKGILATL